MCRPGTPRIGVSTAGSTTPAIDPCISFGRRNTNRDIRTMTTTTSTTDRATATMITTMNITTATDTTTNDVRPSRDTARGLLVIAALLLTPILVSHADEAGVSEAPASNHSNTFSEAVKRDAKAVGATCKEGAHRVAVASKAVAHEIATAAKRGAAETRAALHGQKADPPPN